MALPALPKLFDPSGLKDPEARELAERMYEWCSAAQDLLRALRAGASGLNMATGQVDVSGSARPTPGQVLTATDGTHATWKDP